MFQLLERSLLKAKCVGKYSSRGRVLNWVQQTHGTRPQKKNTGNFIGPTSKTVAEVKLQRTDTDTKSLA